MQRVDPSRAAHPPEVGVGGVELGLRRFWRGAWKARRSAAFTTSRNGSRLRLASSFRRNIRSSSMPPDWSVEMRPARRRGTTNACSFVEVGTASTGERRGRPGLAPRLRARFITLEALRAKGVMRWSSMLTVSLSSLTTSTEGSARLGACTTTFESRERLVPCRGASPSGARGTPLTTPAPFKAMVARHRCTVVSQHLAVAPPHAREAS